MSQVTPELTVDSLDSQVYPQNALSEKLLALQSKAQAIEDAMQAVKKAFDKDTISLEEFLKYIRQLSNKQAR